MRPFCMYYGPEFTSRHFVAWCTERKIQLVHFQPGKPMQNAHVESFNGRLRAECLNARWFHNLNDARLKIRAWQLEYNGERPHSSLGDGRQMSPPQSGILIEVVDPQTNLVWRSLC